MKCTIGYCHTLTLSYCLPIWAIRKLCYPLSCCPHIVLCYKPGMALCCTAIQRALTHLCMPWKWLVSVLKLRQENYVDFFLYNAGGSPKCWGSHWEGMIATPTSLISCRVATFRIYSPQGGPNLMVKMVLQILDAKPCRALKVINSTLNRIRKQINNQRSYVGRYYIHKSASGCLEVYILDHLMLLGLL